MAKTKTTSETQQSVSPAQLLASLTEDERLELLDSLSAEEKAFLAYYWPLWARPEQLPPLDDEWLTWLVLAGRGFGKTRSGAEWVRAEVESGRARRIALIGETHKDLEEVMVFGDSGILSVFPKDKRPIVSKKPIQITFHTGAIALGYNATEPDQLRGPQFDLAWCDELAKWRYARETWDQLQFGLRLGERPRAMVTTTPRPIPLLKEILADELTRVTRGSTYDNAGNLAESFLRQITIKYEGTRLGRQELAAELLEDLPGALWTNDSFIRGGKDMQMQRVVVSIDPSGTKGGENDNNDVGIAVAGKGIDGRGYVMDDWTCNLSPAGWGRRAVEAYHFYKADCIVAETNFGGAMVEHVIKSIDPKVPYRPVIASRGKVARAEPVAALYEQQRVSHLKVFTELEKQMCMMDASGYVGEGSPDRADAAIWALSYLMLGENGYTAADLAAAMRN